jgi:signal transduction histidine kinase
VATVTSGDETTPPRGGAAAPDARAPGDGIELDLVLADPSADTPFAPAVLGVRWLTILASAVLVTGFTEDPRWWHWAWLGILAGNALLRTLRPVRDRGDLESLAQLGLEVVLPLGALLTTGGWTSPFVFTLFAAIAVVGFARGFAFALEATALAALVLAAWSFATSEDPDRNLAIIQWTPLLLIVALTTGYARSISGEADRQHSIALDRLSRLASANSLLFSLHRVAQTLPASLDLDDVLDSTVERLRTLFELDFAAILLLDDSDGTSWHLARREGTRLPHRMATSELPRPLREVLDERTTRVYRDLVDRRESGLAPKATSGMYAVLEARGAVIGLLAVEHKEPGAFGSRDADLLGGLVESVALAIDNARWFDRLRTVGADEERTRIARDLHDRIGQSLAYLAFELDRLVVIAESGEPMGDRVERLRDDVRMVIREVRDTLYDLRTDVSDAQDLPQVLAQFAERVRDRSDLDITLVCDDGHRLPLLQEREMWRIAQEAVTNVERHANARRVRLVWRCNGDSAVLDITDDGDGFPIGQAGRLDSYGLLGMRERAASIGATLELASEPGKGTRVRCTLLGEHGPLGDEPDRP